MILMRQVHKGQALVEVVIWSTVLMLFFFSIPLLGKYIDIKHKNIEASRYAVWERTIYTPSKKSDEEITKDINLRLMQHTSTSFTSDTANASAAVANPQWKHRGVDLVKDESTGNALLADYSYASNPEEGSLTGSFAYKGGGISSFSEIPCFGVGTLGLNGNGYAKINVKTKMFDRFDSSKNNTFTRDGSSFGEMELNSSASILSDSWAMGLKVGELDSRAKNLVIGEPIACVAFFGAGVAAVSSLGIEGAPLFGEGSKSDELGEYAHPNVIPDKLIKK